MSRQISLHTKLPSRYAGSTPEVFQLIAGAILPSGIGLYTESQGLKLKETLFLKTRTDRLPGLACSSPVMLSWSIYAQSS